MDIALAGHTALHKARSLLDGVTDYRTIGLRYLLVTGAMATGTRTAGIWLLFATGMLSYGVLGVGAGSDWERIQDLRVSL